mgnify:CR=1 FL=1
MELPIIDNCKDELLRTLDALGYPWEFGQLLISELKYDKAVTRLLSYIRQFKPQSADVIVDEMLAIRSEIDAWREKKASQQANARYNEILYYGLEGVDEE